MMPRDALKRALSLKLVRGESAGTEQRVLFWASEGGMGVTNMRKGVPSMRTPPVKLKVRTRIERIL